MQIHRNAFPAEAAKGDVARLREACIGCTTCTGICREMLDWVQVPTLVLSLREARS